MILTVKINGTDRSDLINWGSFSVEDKVNEQPNVCNFTVNVYAGQSYKPAVGEEVIITDENSLKIFAGNILSIRHSFVGKLINYEVECKDYTSELDRIQVIDSFDNQTVTQIINYINTNYLTGITTTNVDCPIIIKRIVFNRKSVTECLNSLVKLTNYVWYIDYDKDIHFIAKNTEIAPFSIADNSQNLINDSLDLTNDLSQLRNIVIIRGGDKVATNTRDKDHTTDGVMTVFNTDYKFDSLPTVLLGGVAQSVGVDNLNTTGYDCYWNYNEKYVRFDVAPTAGQALKITGNPLIPIIVQVENIASVSQYGRYEFSKVDKSLKSADDARLYAQAEIDSYGKAVREGGFRTYKSGLSSGQTISINLTDVNISDTFIIQSVSLNMLSRKKGEYAVEIATTQTMGIIKFLRDKLLNTKNIELNENDVLEKYYVDYQNITVVEEIGILTQMTDNATISVKEDILKDPFGSGVLPEFVLTPYTPTGNTDIKREFVLDRGLLS